MTSQPRNDDKPSKRIHEIESEITKGRTNGIFTMGEGAYYKCLAIVQYLDEQERLREGRG